MPQQLNTLAQTLHNTLQAQHPGSPVSVYNEGTRSAGIGYRGFSAEQARDVIPAVLQQLNATAVDYDNLYTTAGCEDTQVTFNIAGVPHYICTCYGA